MGSVSSKRRWIAAAAAGDLSSMKAEVAAGLSQEEAAAVTDEDVKTALHHASQQGDEEMVSYLLEIAPSLVNAPDRVAYTPLHFAAELGHHGVASLLLAHGAAPNASAVDGVTPLHCATRFHHAQVVTLLVEAGADVRARTEGHLGAKTPLHFASRHYDWSVVRELLARGASPLEPDGDGQPALDLAEARKRGAADVVRAIKRWPHIERRAAFLAGLAKPPPRKKMLSPISSPTFGGGAGGAGVGGGGGGGASLLLGALGPAPAAAAPAVSLQTRSQMTRRHAPLRRSFRTNALFRPSLLRTIFSFVDRLDSDEGAEEDGEDEEEKETAATSE